MYTFQMADALLLQYVCFLASLMQWMVLTSCLGAMGLCICFLTKEAFSNFKLNTLEFIINHSHSRDI